MTGLARRAARTRDDRHDVRGAVGVVRDRGEVTRARGPCCGPRSRRAIVIRPPPGRAKVLISPKMW